MDILVVGGMGFVGQYLVRELSRSGHNVLVLARRKRNFFIDFDKLKNVKIVYGVDVLDYDLLKTFFKNIDLAVNLVGLVSFRQKDKPLLKMVNRDGAFNVLKACEEMGVKRLIHLGSTASLGFGDEILNEESIFDWKRYPRCVYSSSKALFDKAFFNNKKVNVNIVYSPLILGPGDERNTFKLFNALREGKLFFSLPGRNSFIDVRDLVIAISFLAKKNVNGNFIVFGGNVSFFELNKKVSRYLNVKHYKTRLSRKFLILAKPLSLILEIFFPGKGVTFENTFMGFQDRVHDDSRIRALGFRPKCSLDKTIKDCVVWFQKHEKK